MVKQLNGKGLDVVYGFNGVDYAATIDRDGLGVRLAGSRVNQVRRQWKLRKRASGRKTLPIASRRRYSQFATTRDRSRTSQLLNSASSHFVMA